MPIPKRLNAKDLQRFVDEWIPTINDALDSQKFPWTGVEHGSGRKVVIHNTNVEVLSALRTAYFSKGWTCYVVRSGVQNAIVPECYLEVWPPGAKPKDA